MTTTELKYDDPIPNDEPISRYCRGNSWKKRSNGDCKIKAKAFRSGSSPTDDISVNWMGYFGSDDSISIYQVCETTTYNGINKKGIFVKLNTTDIRRIHIESLSQNLNIKYRPECDDENPSHSEICPAGDAVFMALAKLANEKGTIIEVPEDFRI